MADVTVLPALMRQLGECPTGGVTALIEMLHHSRPEVREEAASALARLLEDWKLEAPPTGSRRVAALARQMVERCATGEASPAEVVTPLLSWPIDTSGIDATRFFADCQILSERLSPRLARRRKRTSEPLQMALQAAASDAPTLVESAPAEVPLAKLPPEPQAIASEGPAAMSTSDSPEPLEELRPPSELRPASPDTDEGRAQPLPQSESPPRLIKPNLVQPLTDWEDRSDLEVMQELHASEDRQVRAAVAELRRRGYQTHHLPLARSLTDTDPAVRRDLVEALPRLEPDWRKWLQPLLDDANAEVRTAARAQLRTGETPGKVR